MFLLQNLKIWVRNVLSNSLDSFLFQAYIFPWWKKIFRWVLFTDWFKTINQEVLNLPLFIHVSEIICVTSVCMWQAVSNIILKYWVWLFYSLICRCVYFAFQLPQLFHSMTILGWLFLAKFSMALCMWKLMIGLSLPKSRKEKDQVPFQVCFLILFSARHNSF